MRLYNVHVIDRSQCPAHNVPRPYTCQRIWVGSFPPNWCHLRQSSSSQCPSDPVVEIMSIYTTREWIWLVQFKQLKTTSLVIQNMLKNINMLVSSLSPSLSIHSLTVQFKSLKPHPQLLPTLITTMIRALHAWIYNINSVHTIASTCTTASIWLEIKADLELLAK